MLQAACTVSHERARNTALDAYQQSMRAADRRLRASSASTIEELDEAHDAAFDAAIQSVTVFTFWCYSFCHRKFRDSRKIGCKPKYEETLKREMLVSRFDHIDEFANSQLLHVENRSAFDDWLKVEVFFDCHHFGRF